MKPITVALLLTLTAFASLAPTAHAAKESPPSDADPANLPIPVPRGECVAGYYHPPSPGSDPTIWTSRFIFCMTNKEYTDMTIHSNDPNLIGIAMPKTVNAGTFRLNPTRCEYRVAMLANDFVNNKITNMDWKIMTPAAVGETHWGSIEGQRISINTFEYAYQIVLEPMKNHPAQTTLKFGNKYNQTANLFDPSFDRYTFAIQEKCLPTPSKD